MSDLLRAWRYRHARFRRTRHYFPAMRAELERLLAEGDPQVYGYAATNWTVPLLRTELTKCREASGQRAVAWHAALTPFSG